VWLSVFDITSGDQGCGPLDTGGGESSTGIGDGSGSDDGPDSFWRGSELRSASDGLREEAKNGEPERV
jgi:hypothetical protein